MEGVDPFKLSSQAAKGLLFPSFGLCAFMPLREIGQMLSHPLNVRLSSWETGPCLSMLGFLGTSWVFWAQGSSAPSPLSWSPMTIQASVSLARLWFCEEGTAPEGKGPELLSCPSSNAASLQGPQ